jgi:hypothetical protein
MNAFKRSRTLDQNLAGWAIMLPAMNPAERVAMFRGLRTGAPEAVFTAAWRLAERILDTGARDAAELTQGASLEVTGLLPATHSGASLSRVAP